MKYTTNTIENQTNSTTNANNHINIVTSSSSSSSSASSTSSCLSTASTTNGGGANNTNNTGTALFCEQVNTVTNLFEKWNDCERTVVMYALLKRLRYPSLKFLQYSIDKTLTQNMDTTSNLSTVVVDMNANNPSYLQNLLNAYKTFHLGDLVDTLSSSSSDKDSIPCYGSDFQITHCDERKLYNKKEEILYEVLNMLPLLKPGSEEAKLIYLSLIPLAVQDTIRQIVPTELVQQIFSYMLIHPAVSSDDRRTLNVWLRHLEDHLQNYKSCSSSLNTAMPTANSNYGQSQNSLIGGLLLDNPNMTTSGSSVTSSSALSISSSASNISIASTSFGNLTQNCNASTVSNNSLVESRNNDWQTIQPPTRQQQQHQQQQQLAKSAVGSEWSALVAKPNTVTNNASGDGGGIVVGSTIPDKLCDNLNGITLNDLASSQNSLGLNIVATSIVDALATVDGNGSSLVNGVAAAAASATAASVTSVAATPNIFGPQTNPIITIINNNSNCSSLMNNVDDHDTSFSKNGTEIVDFETNSNTMNNCDICCNTSNSNVGQMQPRQQMAYSSILTTNCGDHLDINRWSVDNKFATLKTRRSNSLTTQTISSSASSSNSSVITVNDNCSNSTENLAQFANKPRSFSLSIEHHRGSLTNSGSDTRLDDFKPSYIKFQTRNVGMSSIGLWLKSLRLHKYIELFKNMTYEDMLQINEEYLQSLGVTKGASHKLALCIEKLKDRSQHLVKMEQELMNGQLKLQAAVEELANIVLTPMKPIELVNSNSGEDNVALLFLKVVDIVCTIAQKDPYAVVDDDNIGVILWILDRSIHNEAFVNHVVQLKELKFKLSKLKMSLTPKIHHSKNSSNGNLNKPRWNGKSRKSDQKNSSNDRINHRKNSNDMLNFSLSCLQQQHHHNQQMQQQQQQSQQINEYDKYHNHNNNNNNSNNQYKNTAYQNYQQQQQIKHQQMQQQLQPQILQQHFPAIAQQQQVQQQQQQNPQQQQHRRSLNSLIVVSGGPQQPQKMIFKPGQGILTNTSNDDLTIDMMKPNQQQQQSRKASLTTINNNNSLNSSNNLNANNIETLQQQQQQSPGANCSMPATKGMTTVVMVSNDDLMHTSASTATAAAASTNANVNVLAPPPPSPQILITNNNTQTQSNHNVMLQQHQQQQHHALQQQQLQLLAAAAAAVGNSCSINVGSLVNNCSGTNNSNNANLGLIVGNNNSSNIVLQQCNNICSTTNNNNCSNSNNLSSCNNCNNHQLQINLKLPPLNENYQHHHRQHNSPPTISDVLKTSLSHVTDPLNDIKSLEQLETLCLQMTEQAIN